MLDIIDHNNVREIRLSRPPANALNHDLVIEFSQALEQAGREAGAVVVSGQPGMFSAGLDIPDLLQRNREEMSRFWQAFLKMTRQIAFMPVPTVFAMTGHCPAGGIVMGIFGDYRIMPKGEFKTGFNEVQVGLMVPHVIQKALQRTIGPHTAERILVAGEIMSGERALGIGLVDELAEDPEATVSRAIEWCEQHLALPRKAMLATRKMARADLHELFEDSSGFGVEGFIGVWFDSETQATLQAMVAALKKR